MEQLVARRAHNPKVVGSSPTPATKITPEVRFRGFFIISKYHKLMLFKNKFLKS